MQESNSDDRGYIELDDLIAKLCDEVPGFKERMGRARAQILAMPKEELAARISNVFVPVESVLPKLGDDQG